ncbi:MAG: hypothetical protein ACYDCI_10255 [Candidatus Limnocylindrales bacterium]
MVAPVEQLSTTRLLEFELAFSQVPPVAPAGFMDLAASLALPLSIAGLESLHRQGILLPLFTVDRPPQALREWANQRGAKPSDIDVRMSVAYPGLLTHQALSAALDDGRLSDSTETPFTPWRVRSHLNGVGYQRRAFIYSHYQVLAIRRIINSCPGQDPVGLERRARRSDSYRSIQEHLRTVGSENRRLTALLTALEPAYLPDITERLVGFFDVGEWEAFRSGFNPIDVLVAVGWSTNDLIPAGRRLLGEARIFDPLAGWAELVALVHPSRRSDLTGLAKLAEEERTAAEILLRCHRDLVRLGRLDASKEPTMVAPYHVRDRDEASLDLDRTLTAYGLSPHPSALLVVEGVTESNFVQRALDRHLRPGWRTVIHLESARGVTRDVDAMAALIAPKTGRVEHDVVTLTRPPTRVVVVADAERRYRTPEGREAARKKWVERLRSALPAELQARVSEEDLSSLVELHVWDEDGLSFEFAHFTDLELAGAVAQSSRSPSTPSVDDLVLLVQDARRQRHGLARIWKGWEGPEPNKTRIVESLFPGLLDTVEEALLHAEQESDPPVARILRHTVDLAWRLPRHQTFVLRLQPEDNPS